MARVIVKSDGSVRTVEEVEEERPTIPAEISRVDPGELIACFPAYVRIGRISPKGEFVITLAVPFENKYQAMAMTDYQGVMFDVEVRRPERKKRKKRNEEENGENDDSDFDPWVLS